MNNNPGQGNSVISSGTVSSDDDSSELLKRITELKNKPRSQIKSLPENPGTQIAPSGARRLPVIRNKFADNLFESDSDNLAMETADGKFSDATFEVVIGDDDRLEVTDILSSPWRKIAALRIKTKSGSTLFGTGWFISPTVLITAGHCVFKHDAKGWAKEIEVIPALNGSDHHYGSATATFFESNKEWVNNGNTHYDYGAIFLDKPIDQRIGYFAFGVATDELLLENEVSLSGYPLDRDNASVQYYHSRTVSSILPRIMYYEIDTFGGQSGSPIWLNLSGNRKVAVGIHTNGASTANYGTRLTKDIFSDFKKWKNL